MTTAQITTSFNVQIGDTIVNIPQKNNSLVEKFSGLIQDGNIVLNPHSFHDSIFVIILDNVPMTFNFNLLVETLNIGLTYFNKMEISIKMKKRFTCWVKSLGKYSYTWTELLDKPNYGLELFSKRFWPFFNVECKEWKDISINTLNDEDYPNQADSTSTGVEVSEQTEITKDYKVEYNISQKHNNFLGYAILNPNKYPDMQKILDKLFVLNKLGLKLLMFEAILRLLITPSACHIIKYSTLWKLINPLFDENSMYKELFMHFMYYSMFILNHEYTVMFSQIKRSYRVIFTHPEALNLPQSYKSHIELDPYIQQLTGDKYLVQSIPYYLRCNRYIQPVDVFERRFQLATGGALTNIPLHKYNAAVSGSILIPCISYNELEEDFRRVRFNTARAINTLIKFNSDLYHPIGEDNKLTDDEKDFMSYLEYLYPSYHSLTDVEYVNKVLTKTESVDKIDRTKEIITEESKESDKVVKPKYNLLSDIDISISTDNYDTFDEIAKIIGKQIQSNCKHIGDVWIQKVFTVSSFKYKIYGPGLIRPIDLFRVPYGPEKMVKKFHCPIVRSWYDGSNSVIEDEFNHSNTIDKYWRSRRSDLVNNDYEIIEPNEVPEITEEKNQTTISSQYYVGSNILLSCLSAIMSGVNNNYKWFFNSKPCVEVILKYAQRGFSTILTKTEIEALWKYMQNSDRWNQFTKKDMDMCGQVSTEHLFFSPCVVNAGIRYKLRQFKKPSSHIYSKKLYVGIAKTKNTYGIDISVKCNNKVYMPDTNKINLFTEYIENIDNDEFSDGDDL